MDNTFVLIILVLILSGAAAVLIGRRNRKGCCGSGSEYRPRKKKLKKVIATQVFPVEGMHCEKCANRVTEVINDIPGAAGKVDLKQGTVTVSCEKQIPEALIRERLRRAGYPVSESR